MSKSFLTDIIGNQSLTDGVNRMGVNDDGSLNVVVISGGGGGGGDASAANQVIGNASLASIDSKTPILDGNGHVPVYLDSCPLPTGAATSALQTTGNTKLDSIIAALVSVPVTGTFWQTTQPVSLASQPLPTGASTAAKQPALGTAGTASADVISIQGVASMTPVKVDGSGATQPVSGTFFQATQPISATALPLPTGAALDATLTGGTQKTKLVDSGGTNVATVSSAGALKVDGSAVTQPVSIATAPVLVAGTALIGKVGIDQTTPGTTNAVQDASDGPVAAGTAAGKSSLGALVAATAAPTPTVGQQIALQGDTSGNLRTSPFGATGSFHTASAIGTGAAVPSFTVPAATKWLVKSIAVVITLSTAATRQILMTVSNSGGSAIASNLTPITGAVNGDIYACTFAPGMAQSTSYVVLFTSGFATIPFPELGIGPGSTITLFVNGGVAADAIQLNINYMQVPD